MRHIDGFMNQRTKNRHCDCFLLRLGWAVSAYAILLTVFVVSAMIIDRYDIVKRCLEYCSPYAASVPWLLMIVSVTLLLCIPGTTKTVGVIVRRVKAIGTIEFDHFREDPDIQKEAEKAIENNAHDQLSSENRERLVTQKAKEIKDLKKKIVKAHEEQIQAALMDYDIGIRERDLYFDARYKDGLKKIAVKVFPISSKSIESFCLEFEELREQFKADNFSLHILIYHDEALRAHEWRKEVARIIRISNRIDCVKPYFYSVAKDMSVSPVEDVA